MKLFEEISKTLLTIERTRDIIKVRSKRKSWNVLKGGIIMFNFPCFTSYAATLLAEFEWNSLILPLIWFSVIVLSLIVESQTADLVSIWFAPGAFVAMILAFCDVNLPIQMGVFLGLTVIGLILAFTVIRPRMIAKHKVEKTNNVYHKFYLQL